MKTVLIKDGELIKLKCATILQQIIQRWNSFQHIHQLSNLLLIQGRKIIVNAAFLSLFITTIWIAFQVTGFTERLLLCLLLLIGAVLVFAFDSNSLLARKKSIQLIETPRNKFHIKSKRPSPCNKTIDSGIRAASRIQRAMLPPEQRMRQILPEHFVFFRPKDVISGDFYWIEKIQDKIFLIAGDCTGHGVPGALMTMLCNKALESIIIQQDIQTPDEILRQLDISLRKTLHTEQTQVRNGLDAVVCVINQNEKELQFAGARNHLVIVQNNQLRLIKGDIYSINGHRRDGDKNLNFQPHTIPLACPTSIYMFSDGIQDQFGGTDAKEPLKGQKFTRHRLLELLTNIHSKPLTTQQKIVEQTIDRWQGHQPQIDDMLLIGFKLSD